MNVHYPDVSFKDETEKKDVRKKQSKTMIDDLIQWVELWKEKVMSHINCEPIRIVGSSGHSQSILTGCLAAYAKGDLTR